MLAELVDLFTPMGSVVLAPFTGTITTAIACLKTARSCISVERDESCFRSALDRLRKYFSRSWVLPTIQGSDDKHRQEEGSTSELPCNEARVGLSKYTPSTSHVATKHKNSASQSLPISQLTKEDQCSVDTSIPVTLAAKTPSPLQRAPGRKFVKAL